MANHTTLTSDNEQDDVQCVALRLAETNTSLSAAGARALAKFLAFTWEVTGRPVDVDYELLALEYTQFKTAHAVAVAMTDGEFTKEWEISELDYLKENCTVLTFRGGVIVAGL